MDYNDLIAEDNIEEVNNNESEGVKKIKMNYLYFLIISLFFGTMCTILLYKNFDGITLPFFAITWIASLIASLYKLKIKIRKSSYFFIAVIILLSISTVLTSNNLVVLFNGFFMLVSITIMLFINFYNIKNWKFGRVFLECISMFVELLLNTISPFTHFISYRIGKSKRNSKLKYVFLGILISIPIVVIVLILLISADTVFSNIFNNAFLKFNMGNLFGVISLFCFASIGFYATLVAFASNKLLIKNENREGEIEPIIGITINGILSVIYILFCVIQIKYLFIGGGSSLPEGLTYAEYARSGFFQLLFVSIINFALVLICIALFKDNKMLKILLTVISVCTYIMIASSAYRMILYVKVYNLTFLRILVLWFLGLLTILITGIIINIINRKFNNFHFSFVAVIIFYLVFSFAKVDRIVAHYNINNINVLNSSDVLYMINELSYDAAPEIAKIDLSTVENDEYSLDLNDGFTDEYDNIDEINKYFEKIKFIYKDRGVRKFNYSIYDSNKAAIDR